MANRIIDGNVASIDASGEAGNRGENGVDGGRLYTTKRTYGALRS